MKSLPLILSIVMTTSSAFAANLCNKYETNERYMKAIAAVAKSEARTMDEVCTNPRVLDIEAQPSHIFLRDGTRIPHVRVQFHAEYDSCLYMVNETNYSITKSYCYSGF